MASSAAARLSLGTFTLVNRLIWMPLACNPPEPDFLVRSQIRPNEVMKTAEEFIALRKKHVAQVATYRWGYSVAKIDELWKTV